MSINNVNSVWTDIDTGSNKTQLQKSEDWFGAGIIENYFYFLPVTIKMFNLYSLIISFKQIPALLQ